MPRYHYQALNAEGISLEGMLRANNEREAARALERRGLSVIVNSALLKRARLQ